MMQKTYLSRAMTRAMALDHPIGDPTGGPAYGERNDPISAILSIGTMFMTGTAMMAGSVMAGVAFAGAAISLVGNVTGNKSLMQFGSVVGIIGGLGTMGVFGEAAQGATWGSLTGAEGASAASSAGAGTADVLGQTTSVTPVQNGVVVDAAGAGPAAVDAGSSVATANLNAATGMPSPSLATEGLAPGLTAEGLAGEGFAAGGVSPAVAQAPALAPVQGPAAAASPGFDPGAFEGSLAKVPGTTPGAPAASKGLMEQFSAFAKDSPMAAYGMVNVGAQAVGGLADSLSGKTDAEIDAMKAQTGYADAKALEVQAALDKEKTRRANLNAGYSQVNTSMTVNPNASVAQPWQTQQPVQQPGLIAGART